MRGSTYDLVCLWVATIGQVAFILLWLTRRWWSTDVGQALMAKSASLAALLVAALWTHYVREIPEWLSRVMLTAITAAILWQLAVMVRRIRAVRRRDRD